MEFGGIVGGAMRTLLLAALLLAAPPEAATDDPLSVRWKKAEEQIAADVAKLPVAVQTLWASAVDARDAGNLEVAASAYEDVFRGAPAFAHAARRACAMRTVLGQRDAALGMCRRAVAIDRSAANLSQLATALVETDADPDDGVFRKDIEEALRLAGEALVLEPDAPLALRVRAMAGSWTGDVNAVRDASERMRKLAPGRAEGHYYGAIALAMAGEMTAARKALAVARDTGLAEEDYRRVDAMLAANQPWVMRFGPALLLVLGAWFAAFTALLGAGEVLSRLALRHAASLPPTADAPATGGKVRRAYAGVLWASCVFYLASLPLVGASVLIATGVVIYGFLWIGRIPLQLVAVLLVLAVVSVWSLFVSLFKRVKEHDPGVRLDPKVEPKLKRVLEEVATKVGTRPVDTVFLTAGTELAVFERGRVISTVAGREAERCMLLGVGLLNGFTIGPFRAVLAHEYGHFSNRDTAGGGFALAIRRAVFEAARGLAEGGAATWYNPAWLFLNAFHRVFLRISHGATRLQEILADRFAAFGYGADAFEKGLRHAIESSVVFDAHVAATIQDAQAGAPVANFYTHVPAEIVDPEQLAAAVEGAWNRTSSAYDSHPAPAERIQRVKQLQTSAVPAADDAEPVWSLFHNRVAVEARLTEQVRHSLAQQGLLMRTHADAA